MTQSTQEKQDGNRQATMTESEGSGEPAESDFDRDTNLYDLEKCENLSLLVEEQVYYGGHNLYRFYDDEGNLTLRLNKEEMREIIEPALEVIRDE